jgi:phospholipid N-methyltransferase
MVPSSRFLAKKMLQHIPFETAKTLVELGPGIGAFTPFLLESMRPGASLILIELNEVFYHELLGKIKDQRAIIIHGSATDLPEILKNLYIDKVDCVISSLPLAILTPQLSERILTASKTVLNEGGQYIQFQYSLQSRRKIKRLFGNLKLGFTPWNFPPAFVYTCTK